MKAVPVQQVQGTTKTALLEIIRSDFAGIKPDAAVRYFGKFVRDGIVTTAELKEAVKKS